MTRGRSSCHRDARHGALLVWVRLDVGKVHGSADPETFRDAQLRQPMVGDDEWPTERCVVVSGDDLVEYDPDLPDGGHGRLITDQRPFSTFTPGGWAVFFSDPEQA